jgi:hypothetical protein
MAVGRDFQVGVTSQQTLERELAGPQPGFSGAWPEQLKAGARHQNFLDGR